MSFYNQNICTLKINNNTYYGFPTMGFFKPDTLSFDFVTNLKDYYNLGSKKPALFTIMFNINKNKVQALFMNVTIPEISGKLFDIIEVSSIITTFTGTIEELLVSSKQHFLRPIDGTNYCCKLVKVSENYYEYDTKNTGLLGIKFSNLGCGDKNSWCQAKLHQNGNGARFFSKQCNYDDESCPYTQVIKGFCKQNPKLCCEDEDTCEKYSFI